MNKIVKLYMLNALFSFVVFTSIAKFFGSDFVGSITFGFVFSFSISLFIGMFILMFFLKKKTQHRSGDNVFKIGGVASLLLGLGFIANLIVDFSTNSNNFLQRVVLFCVILFVAIGLLDIALKRGVFLTITEKKSIKEFFKSSKLFKRNNSIKQLM